MAIDPRLNTIVDPWGIGVGSGGGITASNIASNSWVNHKDYAIQGKMYSVNYTVSDWEMANKPVSPDEIKFRLTQMLVEKMAQENHVEFTKMVDHSGLEHKFHARIFVVPDTQVRILRENKVATTGPW